MQLKFFCYFPRDHGQNSLIFLYFPGWLNLFVETFSIFLFEQKCLIYSECVNENELFFTSYLLFHFHYENEVFNDKKNMIRVKINQSKLILKI